MKKRYCPLLLLIIGLHACGPHHAVVAVVSTPDYQKAQSFLGRQADSAFYYFNKIATSARDSLSVAIAYTNMALIQADSGDYFGSQESLLSSLKFLNEGKRDNYDCLVSDYNQLGRNSSDLKNYGAAIDYYDLALKFSNDKHYRAVALSNQAVAYWKLGKYDQASAIYESIIGESRKTNREYARVLTNLAMVRWLRDSTYRAAPELWTALRLRAAEGDDWGLNSSYAHLADYYAFSRPDSALYYAIAMYAVAQRLGSPDDELEALQKLILLGTPEAVKKYFVTYEHLSDSLTTARNSAKNQFALIRYEAEKNKADYLRVEQENTERRAEIFRERVALIGAIGAFVFVVGWLIGWYRRRRRKLEMETLARIRDNELKLSRRVHDVVANGLYRIMTGLEHREAIAKNQLLDEIEVLYERSRDISQGQRAESVGGDFQEAIRELLGSYGGNGTRVLVAGNQENLWQTVGDEVKTELWHVLQELMTNMRKHSEAGNVSVRFDATGNDLLVRYTDDGVGLVSGMRFGNGLTNTGNRIKEIGGRISFAENKPKGLRIDICISNLYTSQ